MKKIAIILSVFFLLPYVNMAQDKGIQKLFNQYKNTTGFELEIEDSELEMDFDKDFDMFNFIEDIGRLIMNKVGKGIRPLVRYLGHVFLLATLLSPVETFDWGHIMESVPDRRHQLLSYIISTDYRIV